MITVLIRDLWTPVWPNLAASVAWTLPVFAWHHRAMRRHVTAEAALTRTDRIEHQCDSEE